MSLIDEFNVSKPETPSFLGEQILSHLTRWHFLELAVEPHMKSLHNFSTSKQTEDQNGWIRLKHLFSESRAMFS